MKKVIKIVTIVIGVLLFLFFGLLTFNYFYNELTISKYEEHDYSQNDDLITHTSVFQAYMAHYNNGNIHYRKGEYEEAIEDYKQALEANPPHNDAECDIRVNLALAIIATLPEDYDALENIDQSIATLEEARDYLLQEECAMDEEEGHNKGAQTLKEEIDDLIEKLKKQKESSGTGDDEHDKPDNPQDNPDDGGTGDDREEEIKEELQQIQEESHQDREDTLQFYEEMDSNVDNWGGTVW